MSNLLSFIKEIFSEKNSGKFASNMSFRNISFIYDQLHRESKVFCVLEIKYNIDTVISNLKRMIYASTVIFFYRSAHVKGISF